MGTPPEPPPREDGTEYRSGTEREFDLMLEALERGKTKRPIILVYTRDDDEAFIQRLKSASKSERDEVLTQSTLAQNFIREHFQDAEGRNLRAYHTYTKPTTFAERLHTHLKHQLDELLAEEASPLWCIALILIMASLSELVFPLQSSCKIRHPLSCSGAKDVTRRPATLVG